MKKPLLIVIVIVVFLILLAIMFFSSSKPSEVVDSKPVATPSLAGYSNLGFSIESNLKNKGIILPEKVATFSIEARALTLEESFTIANSFGFFDQPQSAPDRIEGTVYVWYTPATGYLQISPRSLVIDYKKDIKPANSSNFPTEDKIVEISKNFLLERKLIASADDVDFVGITYVEQTVEEYIPTTQKDAGAANVEFSQKVGGYPLVASTPNVSNINLTVLKDGQVSAVYIDGISPTNKIGDYEVKSLNEVEDLLNQAKVVSINNQDPIEVYRSVRKVVINDLKIGYYQEQSGHQQVLQPVFVLIGTAEFASGNMGPAVFHLPALSDRYFLKPSPLP